MASKSHEGVGCKLSKFDVTFQIISKPTTPVSQVYSLCFYCNTLHGFLKPYFTCLSVPVESELLEERNLTLTDLSGAKQLTKRVDGIQVQT